MKQISDTIIINPAVKFGKPVIKGTRVPVDLVIGKLAGGTSTEELIQEYDLTREQVLAALKHALSLVREEQLVYNPVNYAYTNRGICPSNQGHCLQAAISNKTQRYCRSYYHY